MGYVYANVDELEGMPLVGSQHCVVLVQEYAKAPGTASWKQGALVKGDMSIKKGTAIATFVDGKYPNNPTGNHAALYLEQDTKGVRVMDQWRGDPKKPKVSARLIRFKGLSNGMPVTPLSNNADAYYVID